MLPWRPKGGDWIKLSVSLSWQKESSWLFLSLLVQTSSQPLFSTFRSLWGTCIYIQIRPQRPWSFRWLSVGRVEEGLAWHGPLSSPGLLGYRPTPFTAPWLWQSTEKGIPLLTLRHRCRVHRPPLSHRRTCVFVERPHRVRISTLLPDLACIGHVARVKL